MVIGSCISIIALNVNGSNVPTKRHRLLEWIQKQECAVHKRPTSYLRAYTDWNWGAEKKILHANEKQKKAGIALLISEKTDIKIRTIKEIRKGTT